MSKLQQDKVMMASAQKYVLIAVQNNTKDIYR